MNFDDAIKAHSAWKTKLAQYLHSPDGSLKPEEIAPDNKCALGQWIHGEGASHASTPDYATLKSEHATFHKAAADVVRRANLGQKVSEDVALGGNSPFASASMNVVSAIMAMKRGLAK